MTDDPATPSSFAERVRQWLARRLAWSLLALIDVGSLTVSERGRVRRVGRGEPHVSVDVRSGRFWPALLRGSVGLADAYAEDWFRTSDLVALIGLAARNGQRMDRFRQYVAPLRIPFQHIRELAQPMTRNRNRRYIAAHYDLGNDLFMRMLDPTLSYSCAIFESEEMTLEEAQIAKLERICQKLALGPDDHLLEIGTGWGALALHAAATHGCQVTTTTISAEQYAYARQAVSAAGLDDRITVLNLDYRDLRGKFDKLVSVEMIEAVGWRNIGRYLATCSRLLKPDGLALLQAITIDDRAYEVEKASRSFIKQYIFPGGCLPSIAVLGRHLARRTDLQIVGLEDITHHYVPTLARWRATFNAHRAELTELGYDGRFQRIWNLYLAYCEAGFAERRILDIQLLLGKPDHHRSGRVEATRLGGSGRATPHLDEELTA